MTSVFVSHRTIDSDIVSRLAEDLKRAGHEVRVDVFDLRAGQSIVAFMNDAVGWARYVLLCCSAAGTESPWISREWMSALARQLQGENVVLVPLVLTGADVPAIIADIKYVDLTNYEAGLAELLREFVIGALDDAST